MNRIKTKFIRLVLGCLILSLSLALGAGFFSLPKIAQGDVVSDLQQQIKSKEAEIQALERQAQIYRDSLDKNQSQQKTLKAQISSIDKEIASLRYSINITQKKLEATQLRIEELGLDIDSTKGSMEASSQEISELLNSLNQIDNNNQLVVFLSVGKFSEFFDQLAYIDNLQEKLLEKVNFLKALKTTLEDDLDQSQQTKKQYTDLNNQLTAQKSISEDKKGEKQDLLSETKNQEAAYQKMLSDVEQKQKQVEDEINRLEAELRKHINYAKLPEKSKGLLLWPVQGGYLTQGYGPTSGVTAKFYSFHNGIDIGAATRTGTPILAADDGTVKAVGNDGRYAYGKWVAIQHKYGLTTLYGHFSLISVSPGQQVSRGQVIGYMGSTGLALGPHLHFTVYTTESFKTESRWYGLLPLGASVDPNNYL